MEKIRKFLDALAGSPELQELLKNRKKPESSEEEIRAYVSAARKTGIDISEEELAAYIAGKEKAVRERTDSTSGGIRELPQSELANAAGGKDHDSCRDTYKDKENCWYNDACDDVFHDYPGYICHHVSGCGNNGKVPSCKPLYYVA